MHREKLFSPPPQKKPTYVIGRGWKLLSTHGQEVTTVSRSERRCLKVRALSSRQLLPTHRTVREQLDKEVGKCKGLEVKQA